MDLTQKMIKQAVANLADFRPLVKVAAEKTALTPAVGGQIPPPQAGPMDPSAAGGGPGGPPMDPSMGGPPGGMPPGGPPMDPSMGGAPPGGPPMDPGMGGPPPEMDPSMMGPPPEGDPNKKEEDAASAANLQTGQEQGDVMVPLRAVTDHTVKVIEATKGKRTADAAQPKAPGASGAGPQSPISSLGGAPGAAPMSLPGLGGKAAAARIEALIGAARRVR